MSEPKKYLLATAILASVLLIGTTANAQTEILPEDEIAGAGDEDIEGWNPSLVMSGTLNFVDNTNVVGQVEGLSMLLGLGVSGGADYIKGPTLIRTELTIDESFAKTPVVDSFVKTNDQVALTSTYNYFITKFFGTFARLKLNTALFNARAITADPVNYTINPPNADGAVRNVTSEKLKVASAFKPFTISESLGLFAAPIRKPALNLIFRGGLGGRHTFASGVFVTDDDDLTPEVELQELTNVHQAGLEFFAGLTGKAQEDRLTYSVGAGVLLPFLNNDDYNRSTGDLARIAIEATAGVAVFDWMGLLYKGSFTVDPQLFPDGRELNQYQNSLLLTFQYALIDRKKGIAALKAESALEAAKKKEEQAKKDQEEAERKQLEAEQRAADLEAELEEQRRLEQEKAAETPEPSPEVPDLDEDSLEETTP